MIKTKKKKRLSAFILFLLSAFSALTFNLINRSELKEVPGASLREGITVSSSDDASYLATAENFLENGVWKENSAGRGAYFLRPPAYGGVYLMFRSLLPVEYSLIALVSLQVFLFAFSILAFWRCLVFLSHNEFHSWLIALFFGISPFLHGFLFYTLTEGLSPALLIFYLYFVLKAFYSRVHQKKMIAFLIAATLIAFIFLIRPVLIVFILPLLILILSEKQSFPKFKILFIALLIAGAPMFIWQLRNFQIAGEVVGLHPIYYAENNSIFRPAHKAIWNFHKSWGHKGNEFHKSIVPLWEAAISGDTSETVVIKILDLIPLEVRRTYDQGELKSAYRNYLQFIYSNRSYWLNNKPMPNTINPAEQEIMTRFGSLAQEYRREHFVHSNIIVPAQVYAELAFHSNLSLYVFQKTWRGLWWMEALRFLYFIIHSGIFILFPFAFLFKIRNRTVLALGLPIVLYLGYLCFVQRGVEERYTLPVLLPMVMVIVFALQNPKYCICLKQPGTAFN